MVLNFDDHGVVTRRVVLGETCTALEMEAVPGIRCSHSTLAGWFLKLSKVLINRLPKWTLWPGRLLKASQALPK